MLCISISILIFINFSNFIFLLYGYVSSSIITRWDSCNKLLQGLLKILNPHLDFIYLLLRLLLVVDCFVIIQGLHDLLIFYKYLTGLGVEVRNVVF